MEKETTVVWGSTSLIFPQKLFSYVLLRIKAPSISCNPMARGPLGDWNHWERDPYLIPCGLLLALLEQFYFQPLEQISGESDTEP